MARIARKSLACGVALATLSAALGTPAWAIDTTSAWDGTNSIGSWGVPNTATYGQLITATSTEARLTGFTFYLNKSSGTAPQYQAFVYQWDATNERIVGPALFTSAVMTAPSANAFTPVEVSTGSIALTPGQQYVIFFTTSSTTQGGNSSYIWGSLSDDDTYAGGNFVFQNNGSDFSLLGTSAWSEFLRDLAFIALLGPNSFRSLLPASGVPTNVINVASALDNFTDGGGTLPSAFDQLYFQRPAQLQTSLGQLTGEANTGAGQGAFILGNSFLNFMLSPMTEHRVPGVGPVMAYGETPPPAGSEAFGAVMDEPGSEDAVNRRFSVWAGLYGGKSDLDGKAAVGSHDTDTRAGGLAAGLDYRLAPDTVIGFAMGGGATDWNLSGGLGGGDSDVFQAGAYASHNFGPAYLSAALGYSHYSVSTKRILTIAGTDILTADYDAWSVGGRLEAGYRLPFAMPVELTPYAAVQAQTFRTPSYSETSSLGSPFATSYGSDTANSFRTELGSWIAKSFVFDNGSALRIFGKAAWAHDNRSSNRAVATFTSIPGASFVVNGAEAADNLALVTVGSELSLGGGFSVSARFDGEFSKDTRTYTGTGRFRYTW
ncbi:autotransporter outer membrane beta-barrel domain-containing protein [Afifella sp. IM 167]|uniref:autotransporter domain-containing protein n=1 Tax=Afifella sp. IM 167 TaxID=2033586 RepID=UPI001CCC3318